MSRTDISPYLIHFTSGNSLDEAFARLQKILAEQQILGSGRCIKGGYRCVCFSEAPLANLGDGLVNEMYYSRYSPFGILASKQWIFSLGGRPVIYETEEECRSLPDSHSWRHMRFDLREGTERVDFTWEREWRIRSDTLPISPSVAQVVVPDSSWAHRIASEHARAEDFSVMQYSLVVGEQVAEMYRQPFEWSILTLR